MSNLCSKGATLKGQKKKKKKKKEKKRQTKKKQQKKTHSSHGSKFVLFKVTPLKNEGKYYWAIEIFLGDASICVKGTEYTLQSSAVYKK